MSKDIRLALARARTEYKRGTSAEDAHRILRQMFIQQQAADQKSDQADLATDSSPSDEDVPSEAKV